LPCHRKCFTVSGYCKPPKLFISLTAVQFTILLKRRPNWPIVVYTGIWLLGATGMFITFAFNILSNPKKVEFFLVLTILLLTVFGSLILKIFLWNLRGKEKLTITDKELVLEKLGTIFSTPKKYEIGLVSNFSLNKNIDNFLSSIMRPTIWGLRGGQIVFKYKEKTIYLGQTLETTESQKLIDELNEKLQATNR
jgi:hypothetical protein